jgi:hypothetical protein
MSKSPLGLGIMAGALLLVLSPDLRKAVRKLAVKGTEMAMEASDQVKSYTSRLR